mmetsp:Transcript_2051/g.7753  ORF Transcript_2051/g.7753 Transcript_2051/m.7753 type:complete len:219 (-) Transcript_2051:12-668(-)
MTGARARTSIGSAPRGCRSAGGGQRTPARTTARPRRTPRGPSWASSSSASSATRTCSRGYPRPASGEPDWEPRRRGGPTDWEPPAATWSAGPSAGPRPGTCGRASVDGGVGRPRTSTRTCRACASRTTTGAWESPTRSWKPRRRSRDSGDTTARASTCSRRTTPRSSCTRDGDTWWWTTRARRSTPCWASGATSWSRRCDDPSFATAVYSYGIIKPET